MNEELHWRRSVLNLFFMTLRCIKNVIGFFLLHDCVTSEVVIRESDEQLLTLPFSLFPFTAFQGL